MSSVVSAQCNTPHHELGWSCQRLRGHAGDHMAVDPYADDPDNPRRVAWETCGDVHDETNLKCVLAPGHDLLHVHEDKAGRSVSWPTGRPVLERRLEPLLEPLELETQAPDRYRFVNALVALVFYLLLVTAPALIAGIYRWGF